MENSKQIAIATVDTPDGTLTYNGNTYIDGVTFAKFSNFIRVSGY